MCGNINLCQIYMVVSYYLGCCQCSLMGYYSCTVAAMTAE